MAMITNISPSPSLVRRRSSRAVMPVMRPIQKRLASPSATIMLVRWSSIFCIKVSRVSWTWRPGARREKGAQTRLNIMATEVMDKIRRMSEGMFSVGI